MAMLANNQEFELWRKNLGWEVGYYKHRPPSAVKNQSSEGRDITNCAKGLIAGTNIPIDIIEIRQNRMFATSSNLRVVRIISNTVFPRVVLNRRLNDTVIDDTVDDLISWPSNYQLEGDFHRYFDIMHQKGKEQEVLKLLAPDIMLILTNLPKYLDIEFSGNSIMIYFKSGFSELEFQYSTMMLMYYSHLLANKIIDRNIIVTALPFDFDAKIDSLYSVTKSKKLNYGLREFAAFSIGYFAIVIFIFASFDMYTSMNKILIYLVVVALIYVGYLLYYLKRIAKNIKST